MKRNYYLEAREVIRHFATLPKKTGKKARKKAAGELIGKELLGRIVGCSANAASRHLARYRGETQGHSQDEAYKTLQKIAQRQAVWSDHALASVLAKEAKIDPDQARRWVAWYRGATEPKPETPTDFVMPSLEPAEKNERDLYGDAKRLLAENDEMVKHGARQLGSSGLARKLGCAKTTARRLRQRYWGETRGHDSDPVYEDVAKAKRANPTWGVERIAQALGFDQHTVKLWLARYEGALVYEATQAKGSKLVQPGPAAAPVGAGVEPGLAPQAAVTGVAVTTGTGTNGAAKQNDSKPSEDDPNLTFLNNMDGDKWTLMVRGQEGVSSLEDLLRVEKVDLQKWRVENSNVEKRTTTGGEAVTVKVWLRRTLVEDRFQVLLERFKKGLQAATTAPSIVPHRPTGSGILYEIGVPDLHLGKYAVKQETGEDYNIDIAMRRFRAAHEDLLARAAKTHHPELILLVFLGDFFNVNNQARSTANGTPQDEEGRLFETFAGGKELLVWQIRRSLDVAPVHVIVCPGNHDEDRALMLRECVAAVFEGVSGVTFERGWATRKYFNWHHVLLGFSHGHLENHASLTNAMCSQTGTAFANATWKEFQVGHLHYSCKKQQVFDINNTGVRVRILPCLSGMDAWTASMGYHTRPAAEAYVYDQYGALTEELHTPPDVLAARLAQLGAGVKNGDVQVGF